MASNTFLLNMSESKSKVLLRICLIQIHVQGPNAHYDVFPAQRWNGPLIIITTVPFNGHVLRKPDNNNAHKCGLNVCIPLSLTTSQAKWCVLQYQPVIIVLLLSIGQVPCKSFHLATIIHFIGSILNSQCAILPSWYTCIPS